MKTSSAPIKFGVCGLGRIGAQHCRFFSDNRERYQPVAFCDIDENRARETAAKYHGKPYTDFTDFIADPDMELAIIATLSLDHARHAEQALAAGKMVLLEKPIGVTARDYAILQRLVREYPGKLYCGHNHRFEPAFQNALEIVRDGILGNVYAVKLAKHHTFMRRTDWQMRLDCGGGQLSVWGPHLLDHALQFLAGSPVRNVWSYLRRVLTPGDADDHARIMLESENGVVVEIEISNSVALPAPCCAIYGDRGTLVCGQEQKEIRLRYLAPDFRWDDATASTGNLPVDAPWHAGAEKLPWIEETRAVTPDVNMWDHVEIELARHLHAAIRDGVPFPIKNSDALEVARLAEVIKKQNPRFDWIG
ncbi:scyllo-inositol 2-dehydrogenase (NADP+) [Ereboglobus sp. PH5-5]|uniref:Gfo/Idh/MocA family protein n=1 Tax=Ereboglobus sp. PH5-5 TaxID=2940529 RepID=UPI0024076F5B|nr:Gfo/Idh/MocA family oxidoreductase [Ereboglobus sp. PH5-5]MDF9832185.1 scyllo-inositol 2-dehydrogenase (NADP+) [Ereboglobus sp. PH5-5]